MSLTLNDSKLCNAAEELAKLTGQPLEAAIQEAINARLQILNIGKEMNEHPLKAEEKSLKSLTQQGSIVDVRALLEIGREISRELNGAGSYEDDKELYDEFGVPK